MKRAVPGFVLVMAVGLFFVLWWEWSGQTEALVFTTKPIATLDAHTFSHDSHEAELSDSEVIEAPHDMWISSISGRTLNAPINVIHHVVLMQLDRRDEICPERNHVAFTSGIDNPIWHHGITFPHPYAMFIKKGTPLQLVSMLHNPLPPYGPGGTYRDVSVELTFHFATSAPETLKPLDYTMIGLGESFCSGNHRDKNIASFPVPANAKHFVFKEDIARPGSGHYAFPTSGTILYMHGHFHPWIGGENVSVFMNDGHVTTFLPERMSDEAWSWTVPEQYVNVPIEAGDVLSVQATYSNPSSEAMPGAMGILGFFFAPE